MPGDGRWSRSTVHAMGRQLPLGPLRAEGRRRCCPPGHRDDSRDSAVEASMNQDRPSAGVGHLWAVGYDDTTRASQVKEEIVRLGWDETYLRLSDAAVVVRHPDGSFTLNRE